MNGVIRKLMLLLAVAGCSASGLGARQANRTYFSARNELQQNGRQWAAEAPRAARSTTAFASGLLGFASKSTNEVGLGRYFGGSLKPDCADANGTVAVTQSADGAVNGLFDRQIDHTSSTAGGAASMYGLMQLRPVQKRLGAVFSLSADLGLLLDWNGFSASVTLPFVSVNNSLGVTFPRSVPSHAGTTKSFSSLSTLEHFFAGDYTQAGVNSQEELKYGRVLKDDHVRAGMADAKVTVNYDIARDAEGMAQVRLGLIAPLGSRGTAERLFEAMHGNGNHVGLLMGAAGDLLLWKNAEKGMKLSLAGDAEITFLCGGREKRIPGIYNADAEVQALVPWGHVALGVAYNQPGLFPLANVLARDVDVVPGAHFDATVGLAYEWKQFYAKVGYNLFCKKTEIVDLATAWPVDRYGMATHAYAANTVASNFRGTSLRDAAGDGDPEVGRAAVGPLAVKNSTGTHLPGATVVYQVDVEACTAPSQETQQAVLGLGYRGAVRGVPLSAAMIASYEFSWDGSRAVNGWALGAHIGMAI